MKKLKEILPEKIRYKIIGEENIDVEEMFLNSRDIRKNCLFAAIKGASADGHEYINSAIENGANVLVVEKLPKKYSEKVTWIIVKNTRKAVAEMANKFFENPSKNLTVIAVTGTNGKTSVAWMIYSVLSLLGEKCGLLSTVHNIYGDYKEPAKLTTPDVVSMHRLLSKMVYHECEYVVLEASSHALDQGRLNEVDINVAIFTNLSRDHLDYHGDMLSYLNCKKILFDCLSNSSKAILNFDDKNSKVMIQNCNGEVISYSLKSISDYQLRISSMDLNGMGLELGGVTFHTRITGYFNAYNLAAVIACVSELGFEVQDILTSVSVIQAPEGRLEVIRNKSGKARAIIDYAHTPDAVKSVLLAVKNLKASNQRIICVIGAGGDRDKGKRPLMAKFAIRGSNKVVFTSDNPRSEEPGDIIQDMLDGLNEKEITNAIVIESRGEAIKVALMLAHENDIVVIVGKGHEKYQEIRGERYPFDDKQEVYNYII